MGAYLSLGGKEMGWALIRGETSINFFILWDGRLSEAGTNSRVGAYLNKVVSCPCWFKHSKVLSNR